MKFVDILIDGIQNLGDMIVDGFMKFIDFLATPLAYLLAFLEGIFYFFTKLYQVVIEIIMLFVAMFQFLFAVIAGLFRTLGTFLGFSPGGYSVPSEAQTGLDVFLDTIGGTGFNSILPTIFIFIVWIGFVYKVIQLFGDKGSDTA